MSKRFLSLLAAAALALGLLAGCGSTEISSADHLGDYVRTMDYSDGFTILQLTDIHWNTATVIGNEVSGSIGYLTKVIREAQRHAGKIDLIEITGDTFMLADAGTVKEFIGFMADMAIPYAMVWGNHDREGKLNPNWLSDQFRKAPYSLYTEVDYDDIHERGNYVINLTDGDGTVCWQIVNLDSGASYRDGAADAFMTYDYIRQDQLDWMAAEHRAALSNPPVICYYHIAQAENDIAYEAVCNGEEGYSAMYFKLEGFAPSEHAIDTSAFFAANNVKAAFMGHAHANDWTYTNPDGIVYGLGVKSGTELYYGDVKAGYEGAGFEVTEDFTLSGASLVTLNDASGSFTLEHLYLNERDGGDFVKWVTYQ